MQVGVEEGKILMGGSWGFYLHLDGALVNFT